MPKRPSSWINFQDYLGVNQDQGQGMADRVAGNVNTQAGAAKNQLTQAQADLKRKTDAANRESTWGSPTTSADAKARAEGAGYKGPESLDAVDPNLEAKIADANARVKQAGTSAGQSAILGETYTAPQARSSSLGGSAFDSFLLSGANSGETMRGIQSQYGKLGDELSTARTEGGRTIADAKTTAAGNVDRWTQLQAQLLGKEESDAASAKKTADDKSFEEKWQGAMSSNLGDVANNNFASFNTIMSPISQIATATGNKDPIQQYGTNLITPNAGGASGDGSNMSQKIWWQPQHKEVYRQMDPAQWEQLKKLPPSAQARWLDERAAQIGSGKRAFDPNAFNSTKDMYKNAFYGWKI